MVNAGQKLPPGRGRTHDLPELSFVFIDIFVLSGLAR
jgi:hypothetical protein